jgi:hypothetical protein
MATQRVPISSSNDESIREHVLFALKGDGAHVDFEAAVKDLLETLRHKIPNGAAHSPFEILEHLRIAQWDILAYIRDQQHVSPEFPAGYWPSAGSKPSGDAWERTVESFRADFAAVSAMANDPACDILAPLHGVAGQTIARKLLMLADHNAYHLGELVAVRRALGAWQ